MLVNYHMKSLLSACFLARFHELQTYDRGVFFPCILYESRILGVIIGKFIEVPIPKTMFL